MIILRTYFSFQILDIIDAGKDNGLKSGRSLCFPFKIIISQLGKEIKKYLIIGSAVHFVYD